MSNHTKCPDCRDSDLILLDDSVQFPYETEPHKVIKLDEPYYKCPKCKQEYSKEDLEDF